MEKPKLTWLDLLDYISTLNSQQLRMNIIIQKSDNERYEITEDNMAVAICNNCAESHPVICVGDTSTIMYTEDMVRKLVEDAHNDMPPL